MIGACIVSLAVGCYLVGIAMSKSIIGSLFSISQSIDADQNIILEQLVEFIGLHLTAKQLRESLLENYAFIDCQT